MCCFFASLCASIRWNQANAHLKLDLIVKWSKKRVNSLNSEGKKARHHLETSINFVHSNNTNHIVVLFSLHYIHSIANVIRMLICILQLTTVTKIRLFFLKNKNKIGVLSIHGYFVFNCLLSWFFWTLTLLLLLVVVFVQNYRSNWNRKKKFNPLKMTNR